MAKNVSIYKSQASALEANASKSVKVRAGNEGDSNGQLGGWAT